MKTRKTLAAVSLLTFIGLVGCGDGSLPPVPVSPPPDQEAVDKGIDYGMKYGNSKYMKGKKPR